MQILALETSTEHCSVALWLDGATDARDTLAGERHSGVLIGMVDELLRGHALSVGELDAVAFGAGPGSFTGLRIACGVAQGIAFGAAIPVIGISTLLALGEVAQAGRALCCLDARMGQVYFGAYEKSPGGWRETCAPGLCGPDDLPELPGDGQWVGCGSGFRSYGAAIERRCAGRLAAVLPDIYPEAQAIARLAAAEFARGGAIAAELAAPFYLRDKVALRTDERAR